MAVQRLVGPRAAGSPRRAARAPPRLGVDRVRNYRPRLAMAGVVKPDLARRSGPRYVTVQRQMARPGASTAETARLAQTDSEIPGLGVAGPAQRVRRRGGVPAWTPKGPLV